MVHIRKSHIYRCFFFLNYIKGLCKHHRRDISLAEHNFNTHRKYIKKKKCKGYYFHDLYPVISYIQIYLLSPKIHTFIVLVCVRKKSL